MNNVLYFVIGLVFLLTACQSPESEVNISNDYIESIKSWRKQRVDKLTSGSSWLSLAGLYRLKEGENTFGSSRENKIKFPEKAAPRMGSFYVDGDSVFMTVREEVEIWLEETPVKLASMLPDSSGKMPVFHYESLNWNLLKRGDQYLIRLRDSLNEAISQFTEIDYFNIDENWNIEAQFIAFDSIKTTTYQNVLGMALEQEIEGRLEFEVEGKAYTLEVLDGGPEDFFVVFEDLTTGENTYGGGRYIYIPRPDDHQKTYIDFNKAFNPPCAFTPYATCLLPTPENKLAVAITAGEKNYGEH